MQDKNIEELIKNIQEQDGETQITFLTMYDDPEQFRGLLKDAYIEEALIRQGKQTIEESNAKYKELSFDEIAKMVEMESV